MHIIIHQGPAGTGKTTATTKLIERVIEGSQYTRKDIFMDNSKRYNFSGFADCDVIVVESINSEWFKQNMVNLKNQVGDTLIIVETQHRFKDLNKAVFDVRNFNGYVMAHKIENGAKS